MKKEYIFLSAMVAVGCLLASCGKKKMDAAAEPQVNLNTTVGQLVQITYNPSVPVRGYGMVSGLWGAGSSECPPQLRLELEKYIWQKMPNASPGEIREFIESTDTAIVEIIGEIPPLSMVADRFDIQIVPLLKTQTISLRGGHLFTSDLKEMSRMQTFSQFSKTIGIAEGQIFTSTDPETKKERYYIFNGGIASLKTPITLSLNQSSFRASNAIRNRINERFGTLTANAISSTDIQITIAPQYRNRRQDFLSMLGLLYLSEDESLRTQRIDFLCEQLIDPAKAAESELALEAIGRPCLSKLAILLEENNDSTVRFHAARCMLNIGDNRGISALRSIALDDKSSLQIKAIKSLSNAKLKEIEPFLSQLLANDKIDVRLAAYQQLLEHNSIFVKRIPVGTDFFVDLVNAPGRKLIYALQKEHAGLVLFGAPIICQKDLFLDKGNVMINARPGDKYVSLVRRHPARPKLVGPLLSSFHVEDIIRTLGHAPEIDKEKYPWPGLGINYSEILDIVELMCHDGLIPAEFIHGPLSEAGAFLEKMSQTTDNTVTPPDQSQK
ncbi:MAG: flagellar basal body P-ring protein FlgI [Sedimentisphaerales bacterium]|nr:flagellar basal body P-ring protein FlgI [Sedimentisphaerales bacterium]